MVTYEIGGNNISLALTIRARRDFEVESGVTFNDFQAAALNNKLFIDHWMCLTWACLKAGAKKDNKKFDLSYEMFIDYCDENEWDENEIVTKMIKFLTPNGVEKNQEAPQKEGQ